MVGLGPVGGGRAEPAGRRLCRFTGTDLARAGAEVVLDSLDAFPAWYMSA